MLRRPWPLAVLALALAFSWPMQVTGFNQNAHYALTRAIAIHHVPYVDRALGEVGELGSGDVSRFEGHTYAAKAPGLALVSAPALLVLDAAGMRTTGDPTRVLWALHLWGVVLAGVALVLLTRFVGDRLEPGWGAAAAITLGLGTLLLPFATLFFAHVPAAALGLAAFALAFAERRGPPRPRLLMAAGLAGGLAVTFDYPLVFIAAIVGLYAVARRDAVRRALAFGAGGLVGVLPLLAFNWWAFGSPTHIAYEDYYSDREEVGGVFGFGLPRLSHLYDLLFSAMGLLTLTPVVVLGVAGALLLWRRRPAEALVALGVAATYLVYNASLRYASPFGGLGPPRYLFPLLPFLAFPLAAAYRRLPLTTLALALVSALQMTLATATGALAMYDWDWLARLSDRAFVQTAASIADITGWYTIVPFLLAAAAAVPLGALASPRPRIALADLAGALVALALWGAVALAAENDAGLEPGPTYVLAVAAGAAGAVVVLALLARKPSQTVSASPDANRSAEQSTHVVA